MAASKNIVLLGLLMVSCLAMCASASTPGSVTAPVETMKFGGVGVDLPAVHVTIKLSLTISLVGWLPYKNVKVLVTGAGVDVVPFSFVDGIVSLKKTISVTVSVAAPAPIKVTISIGSVKKTVEVPLVALGSGFSTIGHATDVVSGALMLVKTSAGDVLLVGGGAGFVKSIVKWTALP